MSIVTIMAHERGEFMALEDGYQYYWPSRNPEHIGALSASVLRELADELDRLNADWDATLEAYFEANP